MVDGLILENFKAFGERQYIPLAPITLIFGANSAGKSSIIQSLLFLRQSLENIDSPEQFFLFKGEHVDLGSFKDAVYGHDLSRTMEISLFAEGFSPPAPRQNAPRTLELTRRGTGVKITSSGTVEPRVSIPVYLDTSDQPAFQLDLEGRVDPALLSTRRSLMPLRYRRGDSDPGMIYAISAGLNPEHAVWQGWYDEYQSTSVPLAIRRLEELLEFIQSNPAEQRGNVESLHRSQSFHRVLFDILYRTEDRMRSSIHSEAELFKRGKKTVESLIRRLKEYDYHSFISSIEVRGSETSFAEMRNFTLIELLHSREDPLDVATDSRTWRSYEDSRMSDSTSNSTMLPSLSHLARTSANRQRQFLNSLRYLGPLRGYPERHYVVGGRSSTSVGRLGESSAEVLFGNPEITQKVDDYIQRFGFGYQLRLAELIDRDQPDSQGGVFGVRLIDKVTGINVSLVDVGFGVSQVLPIIVQSLLSKNSTIAIEQPEIHLHPALQAELAELFADSIGDPTNNRFILETHSEHLILRFQNLVRKGTLKPADISVLYVSRPSDSSAQGAKVKQLRLDDNGEFLDEWPGGFFEESFKEMFDL